MPTYQPPLRDIQFVMNEVLDVPSTLRQLPAHKGQSQVPVDLEHPEKRHIDPA